MHTSSQPPPLSGRAPRMLLCALPFLVGCLSQLLEAPYVLTTGLGTTRSLCPGTRLDTMLVASDKGIWEINGSGEKRLIYDRPVLAVSTQPTRLIVLEEGKVLWGPPPGADTGSFVPTDSIEVPSAKDLLAWYDNQILIAQDNGLLSLSLDTRQLQAWDTTIPQLERIQLSDRVAERCVLAVTQDAVLRVCPETSEVLVRDLADPVVAAADRYGQIWVVHGQPPVLARLEHGTLQTIARYLDKPRDMHFGTGQLIRPENAYLADATGTLDYLPVPVP